MNRRSLSAEALNSSEEYTSTPKSITIKSKTSDRWTIICLIFGSISILNAIWMLIAPEHWYYNLPAGVPVYGPLNVHFIRDIGCIFLLVGSGLVVAGFYLPYRLPLFTMHTAFYLLHMFVHIHEVVSGRIQLSMFWTDLPGVYIPAVILFILNIFLFKQGGKQDTVQYRFRR